MVRKLGAGGITALLVVGLLCTGCWAGSLQNGQFWAADSLLASKLGALAVILQRTV
jgi:hypothetical protein